MTGSGSRLLRLCIAYGICLVVVVAHQFLVMALQHEEWSVRSYRNRWAFKDVPSVRGAITDRAGEPIAHDEPTFSLDCVYERFRHRHPVAVAVHGATLATRLSGAETRYSYFGGTLGPAAAARVLLAVPAHALLHADLPKEEKRELQSAAITLLSSLAKKSRSRVRTDLLAAADASTDVPVGAAILGFGAEQLLLQFTAVQARLSALDRALQEAEQQRRGEPGHFVDEEYDEFEPGADAAPADEARAATVRKGLLQRLDQFRVDSLSGRRTRPASEAGPEGELLDRVARPLARDLPFHLAAAVRIASEDQPGLFLEPALRRVRATDLPPSIAGLLGAVRPLAAEPVGSAAEPDYLRGRVDSVLDEGLDELVPDGLTVIPDYQHTLQSQARNTYASVLRARERRGTSGIERALDESLRGEPGLRLVEHDRRSREQRLWSSLRVDPGEDAQITIDLRLQRMLDAEVDRALSRWAAVAQSRSADVGKVEVGLALIDADSGDVLALAGAPREADGVPLVPPALRWRGNGALGSIVKPLFLLEQLIAQRAGFAHANLAALEPCPQKWRAKDGRIYRCDHAHWAEGTDPVVALAKSCNTFFFQVAEALGEDGLRRALWRFGMSMAGAGGGDGRYQARPAELTAGLAAEPRWLDGAQGLPMRGVGYELEANPLTIARAYAALATGRLPTLGLRYGEARASYPLGANEEELALVRRGLLECVESGTAQKIEGLSRAGVYGKTGTAEIRVSGKDANNAWFAGYLDPVHTGAQLAFCAVVYAVPDRVHGADAAGLLVAQVLNAIAGDAELSARWLPPQRGGDRR